MNKKNVTHKKIIPKKIYRETTIALSYYPELSDVRIEFKFKDNITKSFMQAQPGFVSLLGPKKNRKYFVFVSTKFNIENAEFTVEDVPSDVLIGWLGHELGHIMDYLNRSSINLIFFGIKYLLLHEHVKSAERTADTYAIANGMSNYIIETKKFILNHTSLSQTYKQKIQRLYLAPEEIVKIANKLKDSIPEKFH
ncbi:hypothetical protein [Membranihabitans maritimus]|uniref:hypothetical protein n=1 Tax=Membranihabitans maritimus TaxID=2904244 RepID=UPI001F46D47D|nr:hypothetical protein [Membranihabitans maritimus]